jgi:hypothetical protein
MHRPRLLSDNGSSYVASDLATWLGYKGIEHVRGRIARKLGARSRADTLKNRFLLCHYHLHRLMTNPIIVAYSDRRRCMLAAGEMCQCGVYSGLGFRGSSGFDGASAHRAACRQNELWIYCGGHLNAVSP